MTSLHTTITDTGITLAAVEDGPTLYTITYAGRQWVLWQGEANDESYSLKSFKTREGAEFFALHLQAETEETAS